MIKSSSGAFFLPAAIHGIDPGPKAKKATNIRVAATRKTPKFLLSTSLLCSVSAIVMAIEQAMIPAKPTRWRIRLPSLSMSGIVMNVIVTRIAPTPIVAY